MHNLLPLFYYFTYIFTVLYIFMMFRILQGYGDV